MATMNKVIEYVDRVKPNAYTDEDKYRWMRTLEGRVAREVMGDNESCCEVPEDADAELLVKAPYEDVYSLYVMAQIDLMNKEYDHYNNMVMAFMDLMEQFKAWYLRNNRSGGAKNFRNVMG